MIKNILFIVLLIVYSKDIQAQDSSEIVSFTTNYTYTIDSQNLSSSENKAVWSIKEFPQKHIRLEMDGKVHKLRIEKVRRLKKTSDESTIEITLIDVDQTFHLTHFPNGKGNYRMTVYTDRFEQEDGSYSKVHFYTTYKVKDISDLL